MGTMTYRDQYMHPNWQRKRLEVLDDAQYTCEQCGATEKTLHVHHKHYVKGRKVWEYERDELRCLCEDCHGAEHDHKALLDRLLSSVQIMGTGTNHDPIRWAIGMVAGYHVGHFAGAFDEVTCQEAYDVAPGSFAAGLALGGMAGIVPRARVAALIHQCHVEAGQQMDSAVAKLVSDWQRIDDDTEASGG